MKLFLITMLALISLAAAQVPDSATQGPNPQDIATPEPEYIDIDEPLPAAAPAPRAPAPALQTRIASIAPRPIQRPVIQAASTSFGRLPSLQYIAPQRQQQSYQPAHQNQLPGHSFSGQSGYQYRRPVYVRRVVYRRQY